MQTTPESSDSELIADFLDGHGAAFDTLVRRYESALLGFLRRMVGNDSLADDLFQETFLRVMRNLPGYQDRGRFASWMFGIGRNLALDALRRRGFERGLFAYESDRDDDDAQQPTRNEGVSDPSESPEAVTEQVEWGALLESALRSLLPEQREVVVLRFEAGLSFREIADITETSINTALGRMRYATASLKKRLGKVRAEEEADG